MALPKITGIASYTGTSLSQAYGTTSVVTAGIGVEIAVKFSTVMSVSGYPYLTLSNGDTASFWGLSPTYGSGASAYNEAIFTYFPYAGSIATNALTVQSFNVSGATIIDASANALNPSLVGVTQTLPEVHPSIQTIAFSQPSGTLTVGQTETISVGFSEAVKIVGAAPTLTLNDGAVATYLGGGGSSTLTFKTKVASTDLSLSALGVSAVVPNASAPNAVQDASGIVASLSLAGIPQTGPAVSTTTTADLTGFAGFSGQSSYSQNGTSLTLSVPTISDLSTVASAGSLSLAVWFLPSKYTGSANAGFQVAGYSLPQVIAPSGSLTLSPFAVNLAEPPDGTYDVALLLEQTVNGTTRVDAYVNYSNQAVVRFGNDADQSVGANFQVVNHVDDGDGGDGGGGGEGEGSSSDGNDGSGVGVNDFGGGGSQNPGVTPTALVGFTGPSNLTVTSAGNLTVITPGIKLLPGAPSGQYVVSATLELYSPLDPTLLYDIAWQLGIGTLTTAGSVIGSQTLYFPRSLITSADVAEYFYQSLTGTYDAELLLGDNLGNHYGGGISYLGSLNLTQAALTSGTSVTLSSIPVPTTPTGLVASATTQTSTTLSWQPASVPGGGPVSGYVVFENGNQIATVTGTTDTVSGLVANTGYNFAVLAQDLAGNSAMTGALHVTTPINVPAPPTGLSVGATTSGSVALSWQPSSVPGGGSVGDYVVFENGVAVGTITSGTSYTVKGLTPVTSYAFAVAADDASGRSPQSSVVTVTTPVITLPPHAFPDLTGLLAPDAEAAYQQAAAALSATATTIDDIDAPTGSTTVPAASGAVNVLAASAVAANAQVTLPAGYQVGLLVGGGPAALSDTVGGDLLVEVTAQAILFGHGNDTVLAGNGANTIVASTGSETLFAGTGSNVVWLGAGSAMLTTDGATTIVGSSGGATINAGGAPLYFDGSGPSLVNLLGATATLVGGGAETVNAGGAAALAFGGSAFVFDVGSAASTVVGAAGGVTSLTGGSAPLLFFGNGTTNYSPGTASDTLVGGTGELNATGGSGGGLFIGGSGGADRLNTGSGSTTILAGSAGDQITLTGGGADVVLDSTGSSTIDGSNATGYDAIFALFGNDSITCATGAATVAVDVGQGNDTLVCGAALTTLYLYATGTNRTEVIRNFDPTHDFISLVGYAPGAGAAAVSAAQISAGSETASLADGTTLVFQGFTGLSANSFV